MPSTSPVIRYETLRRSISKQNSVDLFIEWIDSIVAEEASLLNRKLASLAEMVYGSNDSEGLLGLASQVNGLHAGGVVPQRAFVSKLKEIVHNTCEVSREIVATAESMWLKDSLPEAVRLATLSIHEDILGEKGLSEELLRLITGTYVSAVTPEKDCPKEWLYRRNLTARIHHVEEWSWLTEPLPENADIDCIEDVLSSRWSFAFWYCHQRLCSTAIEYRTERDEPSNKVNSFHVDCLLSIAKLVEFEQTMEGYQLDCSHMPFFDLGMVVSHHIKKIASEILHSRSNVNRDSLVVRILEVAEVSLLASSELSSRPSFTCKRSKEYQLKVLSFLSRRSLDRDSNTRPVVVMCLNLDLVAAGRTEEEALVSLDLMVRCWLKSFSNKEEKLQHPVVAPARYCRAYAHYFLNGGAESMEIAGLKTTLVRVPAGCNHPEKFSQVD